MVSKGSYFVLLVIVAILTLTLAVLAGYLFFLSGPSPDADIKQVNQVNEELHRPADRELGYINLFSDNNFFNLKSDEKVSVIQLSVQLGYRKSVKGIKNVEEKINFNIAKIKEITGTYFQSLTYEDVIQIDAKEKANRDLTKLINDFLLSNEKYKEEIIYEIVFDKWFCQ